MRGREREEGERVRGKERGLEVEIKGQRREGERKGERNLQLHIIITACYG